MIVANKENDIHDFYFILEPFHETANEYICLFTTLHI